MNKIALLLSAVAVGLTASSVHAKPVVVPQLVTMGETFSFDIVGFNVAANSGYFLTPTETATFGATTTFTGVGRQGQDITITSSESIGALTTTDTFTVSTTNFITVDSLNGLLINGLQFDLGDLNSGSDAISVVTPIGSYSSSAMTSYGTADTAAVLANTMIAANGLSYSATPAFNTGGANTPIDSYNVKSITYTITYANALIPEPSTWAFLAIGSMTGAAAIYRRRG